MKIGALPLIPNSLYYGDCLDVMLGWNDDQVDLIYLDPPFNSNATYNQLFGTENGVPAQVRAFEDTWTWNAAAADRYDEISRAVAHPAHKAVEGLYQILGESGMLAYLTYMAERLAQCKRLLHPRGSIYLHCDPTASHYLKALMDAIFGPQNFRNEVVWKRTSAHNSARRFGPVHDTLLFYSASAVHTWNRTYQPYDPTYLKKNYRHKDKRGRFRIGDLTGAGTRSGESGQPWRGYDPTTAGRHWALPSARALPNWFRKPDGFADMSLQHRLDALNVQGLVYWPPKGRVPAFKRYLDVMKGMAAQDVVIDISPVSSRGAERLGYPTQKPLSLLERLIEASSNPRDLVLDPFCGCGTTIAAADKLQRRWVGIDISPFAIQLVRDQRLKDSSVAIHGIPTDLEGAKLLLANNPFDFEAWIVSCIEGLAPNEIQVGDRGIDGRGKMFEPLEGEKGMVLAQVKGGGYTADSLRSFEAVMQREKATAGVFVTLKSVKTPSAHAAARKRGFFELGASRYPRMQFWSVEDYFNGSVPRLPAMADPYTGKPVQPDLLSKPQQNKTLL